MSSSADAQAWAMRVKGISATNWRVLINLAVRCGHNGFIVWPSFSTISDDCDISRSTAIRAIKELAEAKLIEVLSATRDNGSRTSNRYRLMVKTVHYLPGGKTVELDASTDSDDDGGSVNLTLGGCQIDTRGSVTGDTAMNSINSNSNNRTLVGESELDLGLDPLPLKKIQPADVKAHIEKIWADLSERFVGVCALRGGSLDEGRLEIAIKRAEKHMVGNETVLDVWSTIGERISENQWLRGEAKPRDGREPFKLQMTWLLKPSNFVMALEAKKDVTTRNSATSPSGQTVLSVLERRRAGSGRPAAGSVPSRTFLG